MFKDHFSKQAKSYADFRPSYPLELFTDIVSCCGERRNAWDCATGNGQAAVDLVQFFDQVYATDASASQIQQARPHPKIQYSVATAEDSQLAENSMDLISVAQALHWFDFTKFFAEVKRVAAPAAILGVWAYGLNRISDEVDALISDFYHNTVGPFWPPERRHIEVQYRDIQVPFSLLFEKNYTATGKISFDACIGYLQSWSATQGYIRQRGVDPTAELAAKLKPLWRQQELVNWPIFLKIYQVS